MTASDPQAADGPARPRLNGGVRATATFMVSKGVETSADLLSCNAGEFHTVTMAFPDGDTRLVLAGSKRDLRGALRAALAVLES